MKPMKFGIGQPIRRVEDQRFITGAGRYSADVMPAGYLTAFFLRSPHACARIVGIDAEAARKAPGVRLVLTASDVAHLGQVPCLAPMANPDGQPMKTPDYPVLARDRVRHVGDAVAMIVAESEAAARDAAEAIAVDYAPEAAVVGSRRALETDAPKVWPEFGTNVAYENGIGSAADVDPIFASAHRTCSVTIVNNRLVTNYMETRAAIGEYDSGSGRYTLTTCSQGVNGLQGALAGLMKIGPEKLRVVTPDVGGGFGTKSFVYREYPLLLEAAKRLGKPVRWVADRTEHFLADAQGRDNITKADMALDKDGRFLALRVDILADLGAYLSQFGPYIPWLGVTMATGPYDIPKVHARVKAVYTNTVPVDAYRGAGRPEAAYVLERLVDVCARESGIPREEIRARNFVKPSQMPYATPTGRTYDVGEFEGAMRRALEKADWSRMQARREAAKKRGKLLGVGMASYIECTAWGAGENGTVTLERDGTFSVVIGTQSNGQGHATAYAQIVAQHLDVDPARVKIIQGDTDIVKTGGGTGGSRSIPVGAVMVTRASEALAEQLRKLAAEALEAAAGDIEFSDGAARVIGTDRKVSFEDIAKLPQAKPDLLTGGGDFTPPDATYPNGTHVCELEIDPLTGETEIVRYTVCDDFGMTLNPLLLAGQVHGGIAQGVGQALMEQTVYAPDGQLLTASFMDYQAPRAQNLVAVDFETRNVPSTTNPLGLKGAGEAGSIGSTPAVVNAVIDALENACGITSIDMPATPARIFEAIAGASRPG
ncbi:MAG: xanthine dehydrogenase family protein molybdopterin-binding subunit [Hyphomicrobiales bacterium]|nr:xanthine dehydrogenase family protein molybdopterin-binding subunit [Hyphomicrobiales bacterium]